MSSIYFEVHEFYFDSLVDASAKFTEFVNSGTRVDLTYDGYQFIVVSRKPHIAGDSAS